jgi:hypothetical protein
MPLLEIPIAASLDDQAIGQELSSVYPPDTAIARFTNSVAGVWAQKSRGGDTTYRIRNALFQWDTSAIPDNAVITGAWLRVHVLSRGDVDNRSIRIRYYNWGGSSNTDYTAEDFDSGGTAAQDGYDITNLTAGQVNDIPITDFSGINKSGTTKLRVSVTGGQPTGSQDENWASFENTNSQPVAKLVIRYNTPSIIGTPSPNVNANGTTATGTREATLNDGELLVAFIGARNNVLPDMASVPTGWVAKGRSGSTASGTHFIFQKYIDGTTYTAATEPSSYDWTFGGGLSAASTVIIFRVRGAAPGGIEADAQFSANTTADNSIECPSITPLGSDRLVLMMGGQTANVTTHTPPADTTEFFDHNEAVGIRSFAGMYFIADGSATGQKVITMDTGTSANQGLTFAIEPFSNTQTLRPTTGGAATNLNSNAYNAGLIDEPTNVAGAYPGDWLTGVDPSPTSTQHPQQFADARALWTGSTAHTWTNEANARDTSDATFASYALGANSTDYIDHWSFNAADFTGIPSGATITGIQVLVRMRAGTNNRLTAFIQMATANGSVLGNEYQVDGGTAIPTTVGDFGGNATWDTLPTRAQLVTGTFGIRTRLRRTNTVTAEMYSIKVTVTYVDPTTAQTINTEVRAPMTDPSSSLSATANGTLKIRVGKKGTGTNPQVRAELRNAAGTLLGTPIANTTVSALASAGGVELTNTFAQSLIGAGTDVVVWVVGTGASGGLVEVDSIEAVVEIASTQSLSHTVNITVSASISSVKGVAKQLPFSVTGAFSVSKAIAKSLAYSAAAAVTTVAQRVKLLTLNFAASAAPTVQRAVGKRVSIPVGAAITMLKAASRRLTFAASAAVSTSKALTFLKNIAISASATLNVNRGVGKSIGIPVNATVAVQALKVFLKNLTFAISASPTIRRAVAKALPFVTTSNIGVSKSVTKGVLNIVVGASPTVSKNVGKVFNFGAGVAVSTQALKVFLKNLTFAVSASPTIRRALGKTLPFTATSNISISKGVTKTILNAVSANPAVRKVVGKAFNFGASVAVNTQALKVFLKNLTFNVSATIASPRRAVGKVIPVDVSVPVTVRRGTGKVLAFTVNVPLTIQKVISKAIGFGALVSVITDAVKDAVTLAHTINIGVSASPTVRKAASIVRSFSTTATPTTQRSVAKRITTNVATAIGLQKSVGKTITTGVNVIASVIQAIAGVLGGQPGIKFQRKPKQDALFSVNEKQKASFTTQSKLSAWFWRKDT